jgi:general secretion pathway protein G
MALVLMGLIGGLVVPRLSNLYQSLTLREQRENLLHQITALPHTALQTGEIVSLGGNTENNSARLQGLEGWKLESDQAVVFRANGFCTGGSLRLLHESGESWNYLLRPPYCQPERVDDFE